MAKSIPAIITPEVLAWARNLDGITIDDIAAKLHTAPEKILSWEQGTSYPTVTQAKIWRNSIGFHSYISICRTRRKS